MAKAAAKTRGVEAIMPIARNATGELKTSEGAATASAAPASPATGADAAAASTDAAASPAATVAPQVEHPAGIISTDDPGESDDGGAGSVPAGPAGDRITITVIGPAKGLRRAGYHFGAEPSVVHVTTGELKLIEDDPLLAVSRGAMAGQAGAWLKQNAHTLEDFVLDGEVAMVRVLGPAKGRRRAGFQFGAEAQTVKVTVEQLKLILGDPELSVMPVESKDVVEAA